MKNIVLDNKKFFKDIAIKYKLDILILFGSRARGDDTEKSDYDLAFYCEKQLKIEKKIKLRKELYQLFKEIEFDLVDLNEQHNITLNYQVFKEGICLHNSSLKYFESKYFESYFNFNDYKQYQNLRIELLQQ